MTCRIHQLVSYSFYYVAIYRVLLILHYTSLLLIHKGLEEEECTMSTDNDGNLGHCNNDGIDDRGDYEFIDNGDDNDDDDDDLDPGADVNEHIACSDGENFIFLWWILIVFFLFSDHKQSSHLYSNDTSNYQASTTFNFSHDGSPKC